MLFESSLCSAPAPPPPLLTEMLLSHRGSSLRALEGWCMNERRHAGEVQIASGQLKVVSSDIPSPTISESDTPFVDCDYLPVDSGCPERQQQG